MIINKILKFYNFIINFGKFIVYPNKYDSLGLVCNTSGNIWNFCINTLVLTIIIISWKIKPVSRDLFGKSSSEPRLENGVNSFLQFNQTKIWKFVFLRFDNFVLQTVLFLEFIAVTFVSSFIVSIVIRDTNIRHHYSNKSISC